MTEIATIELMRNLIGTDEAGYGPNLGPLTVTGTLWQNGSDQDDLYHALEDAIKSAPDRKKDNRIVLADSKVVYKSSGSIANLETSVLSIAGLLQSSTSTAVSSGQNLPGTVAELFKTFCPKQDWAKIAAMPWFDFDSIQLPLKAKPETITLKADHLIATATTANIALLSVDCRCVFPTEFNRGLAKHGNKASLLSNETLDVLSHLKSKSIDYDLEITCDKHGGRSRYVDLIQNHLTDAVINVGAETTRLSDYSFTEQDRDVVIRFQAGGKKSE